MLPAVAILVLAVAACVHGNPIVAGTISGTITSNSDGTVTLTTVVVGGTPEATTFTWTLPDGAVINSGENYGTFATSQVQAVPGRSTHTLVLNNGYTSVPQTIVFRAQATWWATYTFNLQALSVPGQISGNIASNADGSVTLTATVVGGTPEATSFTWTLPDGAVINSGDDYGTFATSSKTTVPGTSTHTLILNNGYTSVPQTIVFRAEATWWATYTYYLGAVSSK